MNRLWRMVSALGFSALVGSYPSSALAVPEVKIADGPLSDGSGNVHPNLILSLSLEFPMIGIAYRADEGTSIRPRNTSATLILANATATWAAIETSMTVISPFERAPTERMNAAAIPSAAIS